MKALTLWQPWASLVIAGAKPYEFRGWRPYRSMIGQRVVIHAAARKIDRAEVNYLLGVLMLRDEPDYAQTAAETCLIPSRAIPILNHALCFGLPHSAGLGTAIIGEPKIGTDVAADFGVQRANDSDRDQHANWAWPMLDIETWDAPLSMRGAQGFWSWPEPATALL